MLEELMPATDLAVRMGEMCRNERRIDVIGVMVDYLGMLIRASPNPAASLLAIIQTISDAAEEDEPPCS